MSGALAAERPSWPPFASLWTLPLLQVSNQGGGSQILPQSPLTLWAKVSLTTVDPTAQLMSACGTGTGPKGLRGRTLLLARRKLHITQKPVIEVYQLVGRGPHPPSLWAVYHMLATSLQYAPGSLDLSLEALPWKRERTVGHEASETSKGRDAHCSPTGQTLNRDSARAHVYHKEPFRP